MFSWYPSGVVGKANPRKQKRCGDAETAQAFAATKYEEIERHRARGPLSHMPLGDVMKRFIRFLRASNTPQGTTDQYRSNRNCHVPEDIAELSCGDLDVSHWTRIFEELLCEGATKETLRAVSRTLGALINYAEDRNYFGGAEPFQISDRRRGQIVAGLIKKAPDAGDHSQIGMQHCPSPSTIHRFARVAEQVMPGYGFLLVLLAFASGLRFTECLGLHVKHINLSTGEIQVAQQLNRYQAWPAVAPPKGGKQRTVRIWAAYEWVLQRLVDHAATHEGDHAGWLFPPDRSVTRWADRVNRLLNQDAVALMNQGPPTVEMSATPVEDRWCWTFHWLRHSYASYSLASREHGGLGFSVTYVQRQLGHAKPSTTTDKYQGPISGEEEMARRSSQTLPWEVWQDLKRPTLALT